MMGLNVSTSSDVGSVRAMATTGRGLNPDEITDMLMDRLISVADTAPFAIKVQAQSFKADIRGLVLHYVKQAQKSQNTSIYNVLMQAGQQDAAELVRKL
jgi:hypothetical protein